MVVMSLPRARRPPAGSREAMGHWRAISPSVMGSITVTSGASVAQVRAVRGPDRSDSQADSAGSIPVTRSTVQCLVIEAVEAHCRIAPYLDQGVTTMAASPLSDPAPTLISLPRVLVAVLMGITPLQ